MRVEDIMETDVEVADPSTPARAAWDRMRRHRLRMFAVIDTTGIVGLVTREQLGGRCGALNRRDRTLGDFVRSDVVSTTPECSLAHTAALLNGHIEGCVPVLQGTRLVGVLTIAHLLERISHSRRGARVTCLHRADRKRRPVENGRSAL